MGADPFVYPLGTEVQIAVSSEAGIVVGRADYINQSRQYLIRYKAADGRGIESWWAEDALIGI